MFLRQMTFLRSFVIELSRNNACGVAHHFCLNSFQPGQHCSSTVLHCCLQTSEKQIPKEGRKGNVGWVNVSRERVSLCKSGAKVTWAPTDMTSSVPTLASVFHSSGWTVIFQVTIVRYWFLLDHLAFAVYLFVPWHS